MRVVKLVGIGLREYLVPPTTEKCAVCVYRYRCMTGVITLSLENTFLSYNKL